jgi:hypothetical protein
MLYNTPGKTNGSHSDRADTNRRGDIFGGIEVDPETMGEGQDYIHGPACR